MILWRYLHREVLKTMLVTTSVLLAIFICNQFVRYLGDAAIGRVTARAVMQLMLIQVPLLSGFMLPLGYFIAVLLSYGRLYADSEMTILFASGVSRLKLLGVTLLGACGVGAMVLVLMTWIEPNMAWYRDHILAQAAAASPVEKVTPGRFHEVGGRWVFYVGAISRNRESMQQVFAAEQPNVTRAKGKQNTVLFAKEAKQAEDKLGRRFIEFQDGTRYKGTPGGGQHQVVQFRRYGALLPQTQVHMAKQEEFMSMRELMQARKHNHLAAAELQWRLSMPLSVLILALFAMPLSRVLPRQGRFARFLPAIIIYTIYIDLLFVFQSWVEKGTIDSAIGMWWVHGIMLLFGVSVAAYHVGWRDLKRAFSR